MSYGFQRARLHYAYMLLRGRDFENGVYTEGLRIQNFEKLKQVLEQVLDVQIWKNFLKCVEAAGFVSKSLISSENALVYSYVMYLFGKFYYGMSESALRKLIAKWFFMTAVTGYYTGSPETDMESDLADLRNVKTEEAFITLLEKKIASIFTGDYFAITLPNSLANSAPRNPSWFGYCAALNVLDAKVLFSTLHTRELFDPTADGKKKALEKHHLFPKAYLARIGIADDRDRNQMANFAFIEWSDNIEVLDTSPAEYMKDQLAKIAPTEKGSIYADHALPEDWEHMDYFDFLSKRRVLMAEVVNIAQEISQSLTYSRNGASAIRSADVQPLSIDRETRFTLCKAEEPLEIDPPILSSESMEELNNFILERTEIEKLLIEDIAPPNSLLFIGKPGAGKTYSAK